MLSKKIQEKVNMFTHVDELFLSNAGLVDTVPALSAQAKDFHDGVGGLAALTGPLQLDSKGNAKAKKKAKEALGTLGGSICGIVRSFAEDTDDMVLRAKVNYNESSLKGLSDRNLQETSKELYKIVSGLAAELLPYGITASDLMGFEQAVNKFTNLNPKVRAAIMDNKTLLQQLKLKINALNDILRFKLDDSMKVMKLKNPDFYMQYQNFRRNYAIGTRHRQPDEAVALQPKEAEAADQLSTALSGIQIGSNNGVAVS